MSINHYSDLCYQNCGRAVEITTHDGTVHRGIIDRVDDEYVYLNPLDDDYDSFGYGFGGFFLGGLGFGAGIALGAIAAFTLLPLFFW